jgi:hypothetical protein
MNCLPESITLTDFSPTRAICDPLLHLPAATVVPSNVIRTSCSSPVEESTAQSYNTATHQRGQPRRAKTVLTYVESVSSPSSMFGTCSSLFTVSTDESSAATVTEIAQTFEEPTSSPYFRFLDNCRRF